MDELYLLLEVLYWAVAGGRSNYTPSCIRQLSL
jgi:hypothetical protein